MKKSDKMRKLMLELSLKKPVKKERVRKPVKEIKPIIEADLNKDGVVDEKDMEIMKEEIEKA